MNFKIELTKIKDVEKRISEFGDKYVRVIFIGHEQGKEEEQQEFRTMTNLQQFQELKNYMELSMIDKVDGKEGEKEFINNKNIILSIDPTAKNLKEDKMLIDKMVGKHKGKNYEYYELHIANFIINEIVKPAVFKKDYSELF